MRLKTSSKKLEAKLKLIKTTTELLKNNQNDRWKNIKLITKQQQQQTQNSTSAVQPQDGGIIPVWTQRMETLFGPLNDQLRLIKCENCGILTRETNSKVGVTHKLNCEMLRKSGSMNSTIMSKKFGGQFSTLETNSKKRASSEVSLDSTSVPMKKKKKTTIIDHTQPLSSSNSILEQDSETTSNQHVFNGVSMTHKQLQKELAKAQRLEREKERKEKKRLEEEARKAKKLSRAKGGPVNVNEQCGVLVPPNDTPCARSLTCKTHSMGAKRSVPGRSAPYDVLLNEWQKKHNPNWGDRKVVTPRVGPGIEPGLSKKKKKELANQANKSTNGEENNDNHRSNSSNQTNKNSVSNGSTQKSNTSKDKEKSANSNSLSKSTNPGTKSSSGANGGAAGSSNGNNKKSSHSGQSKSDNRTISEKISAINQAKLLGEVDDDFYLIIPAHLNNSKKKKSVGQVDQMVDEDGDTPMALPGNDAQRTKPNHQTLPQEPAINQDDDQDDDQSVTESDIELELVIKGLIVSQSNLRPVDRTLSSHHHHSKHSAYSPPYSLHSNYWSKFGKLGVKENFKNAFKVK